MNTQNSIRTQLFQHKHSYFFSYFWSLLIAHSVLCYLASRFFKFQLSVPWSDSLSYIDYTSKYAGMIAALLAILQLSVRNSEVSELITGCLSRKLTSFFLAAVIYFNLAFLATVNFVWFTNKIGDSLINKLAFGIPGIGFSLASIITPYLFVLLAQGNLDVKRLQNRAQYLTKENECLEQLRDSIHKKTHSNMPESARIIWLRTFTYIPFVISILGFVIFLVNLIHRLPEFFRIYGVISTFIIVAAIFFCALLIPVSWTWRQYKIQQFVDYNVVFPNTLRSRYFTSKLERSKSNVVSKYPKIKELTYGVTPRVVVYGSTICAFPSLFIYLFYFICLEIPPIKSHLDGMWSKAFATLFLTCLSLKVAAAALDASWKLISKVKNPTHSATTPTPLRIKDWANCSILQTLSKRLKENNEDIDRFTQLIKESQKQDDKSLADKQSLPDEVPPADSLPQNEGGEEDGD